MKTLSVVVIVLFQPMLFAQNSATDTTTAVYRFQNGNVSSEGLLVNGKPDGYWKTYHENGRLKSEGNRKHFLLDSTWKFYDETGNKTLEINYKEGRKQGLRTTYQKDEVVVENFEQDIKQGYTLFYDGRMRLVKKIPFENGLENGQAWQYDSLGTITEMVTYKKGYITARERINRRDSDGKPHGMWKWFYDNGSLKSEGSFKNGLKNGIFKYFDQAGNLTAIEKYVDDIRQDSAEEVARLELKRDYYPSGKVKVEATYKKGVPEGIRREFDEDGNVIESFTFSKGVMVAKGIISNEGLNEGSWKELYPNGMTKSEGIYHHGKRRGEWLFYYPDGALEQKGTYNEKGLPHGEWTWFYKGGNIHRQEHYRNGERDGKLVEYSPEGFILSEGDYISNREEGFWVVQNGFQREEGSFSEGMLTGLWKHFGQNEQLLFEGSFIEDNPHGLHTWYYDDGTKKEQGKYIMGRKDGIWQKWAEDGSLIIMVEYENGIESAYDGVKIEEEDKLNPED